MELGSEVGNCLLRLLLTKGMIKKLYSHDLCFPLAETITTGYRSIQGRTCKECTGKDNHIPVLFYHTTTATIQFLSSLA